MNRRIIWLILPHLHNWEKSCVCKYCGEPDKDALEQYHNWDRCMCKDCGKLNSNGDDSIHQWEGCHCKICHKAHKDTYLHTWEGCFCSKCGNYRHAFRKDCTCNRCGMHLHAAKWIHSSHSGYSQLTKRCIRCNTILHSSTIKTTSAGNIFSGGDTNVGSFYDYNRLKTDAKEVWEEFDEREQSAIENSFWCSNCSDSCSVIDIGGAVERKGLILRGKCNSCGSEVARLVSSEFKLESIYVRSDYESYVDLISTLVWMIIVFGGALYLFHLLLTSL